MNQQALLLTQDGVDRVQDALRDRKLDGWLLFEFHGQNPIAMSLLGLEWTTRRSFVLIPAEGEPVALIHAIESAQWRHWPWARRRYAGWREMETELAALLGARKRLAMEVSPRSSVPTIDRVPSGVVGLLEHLGVEPVSSGDLVSTFHSRWSAVQLETHRRTSVTIAGAAREAFDLAARRAWGGDPMTEGELSRWIRTTLTDRGVGVELDCIVGIGRTAADPHYQPGDIGEVIDTGELLLIDLWGKPGTRDVFADQTWMGYLGSTVPNRVQHIWEAVRDARDAGVTFLRERFAAGAKVRGYEVDDVCRAVIRERGYGNRFVHRTGHSIDVELHGSGPNLDNLESRDDRILVPGVGFSIEPGVYVPGEIGVRSEVNVFWGPDGPEVTSPNPQEEIFLLSGD